jgi:hypothetical protein
MSSTLLTLFDTDRYHEHYRSGLWRDDTIYALVRAYSEKAPRLRLGDHLIDKAGVHSPINKSGMCDRKF